MAVDIRPSGQNLELEFDRADLQEAYEGVDNILLFPGASEQKVDGRYFNNFDIAVVFCINNAIFDLPDGKTGSGRIERRLFQSCLRFGSFCSRFLEKPFSIFFQMGSGCFFKRSLPFLQLSKLFRKIFLFGFHTGFSSAFFRRRRYFLRFGSG